MKTKLDNLSIALALLAGVHQAFAQGTAFTYQGRLNNGASPASGSYDLKFTLYATNVTGSATAGPVTNSATAVTNGLFTTLVDFGPGVFTGGSNWLEIAVSTNGANSFTTLAPRQQVAPTPYAVFAEAASSLSSLLVQQNTNGAPNLIGGSSGNFVSNGVVGATISGGGALSYNFPGVYTNSVTGDFGTVGGGAANIAGALWATVGGGYSNIASDLYGTVSGGGLNTASGFDSVIGGGYDNFAIGESATVGGGQQNIANGFYATVSGGAVNTAIGWGATVGGGGNNTATNFQATVSGGDINTATGQDSTVPGGFRNTAGGDFSFAAGHQAKANHQGAFVWADSQAVDFTSTASNQFLIRAQGGVGIGNNNPQAPLHVTGGGDASLASGGNFISGQVSGQNLVIDNNEIISRNNEAASDLILNFGSGNVGIGRTPTANRLEVGGEASKATAGNWLANSDARIKTDIQTVTGALDKISHVRLVQFRYTGDYRATHPGVEDREYLNVVAQEFQKVFPEDVKRSGEKLANGDDILQVDTYPLTIYSAAAVQELNQELKEKSSRINALEKQLLELQQAVKQLTDKSIEL